MTPEKETPVGHRDLIKQMQAQKAAEAGSQVGGKRCRIHAFRHAMTGQFYAMSHEDRRAFDQHSKEILADLKPETATERWLATSIAEDMWRLSRARAVENNIFALGMSGPVGNTTDADSPEVHAAACHARVWLADGKNLQGLTLYEHRIRRLIEKNQKELKQLQADRKAAYDKAFEEAKLLAWLAIMEGGEYDPAEDHGVEDGCRTYPGGRAAGDSASGHGFGFSAEQINRIVRREMRLQKAAQLQKQAINSDKRPEPIPFPKPKAA